MVWPEHLLNAPPAVRLPPGYVLRTYRRGDEPRFYEIMERAGWPGWNDEKLQPWLERILPEGWFMAVHEESNEIVATAMALRDCSEFGRPRGELGFRGRFREGRDTRCEGGTRRRLYQERIRDAARQLGQDAGGLVFRQRFEKAGGKTGQAEIPHAGCKALLVPVQITLSRKTCSRFRWAELDRDPSRLDWWWSHARWRDQYVAYLY